MNVKIDHNNIFFIIRRVIINISIYSLVLFVTTGCLFKSNIKVTSLATKNTTSSKVTISNIQVVNNQILVTGTNLNNVSTFDIDDGSSLTNLQIESKSNTSIVANTLSNVTFAAGKILSFVLSDASAASTFSVNFSLCDSTLGGKGFNCALTPNDKDVLSYDAGSGKWKPRSINGLSYQGLYSAASGSAPTSTSIGDYYIINVAGTISGVNYSVGDWIVLSAVGDWERINNSTVITSVFGRTGAVVATEGDYNLDKLSDVNLTVAPTNNQVLQYNSATSKWIAGTVSLTESDPTVMTFAKTTLPTCLAGEVLKSNGTSLSCVTDVTGAGSFSGTSNRAVMTDGTGALTTSSVTNVELGYLSGATSNIQAQLANKEGTITAGSTAQYIRGDKTLSTFATDAINSVLSTYAIGANTAIGTGDSIVAAFGKTQAQLNAKVNSSSFVDWSDSGLAQIGLSHLNLGANNFVVTTNGSGLLTTSSITTTKLGYLSGVTSDIQTQINNLSSATPTSLDLGVGNASKAMVTNASGVTTVSATTATELGYLSGTTSSVQTQIDSKQATLTNASIPNVSKVRIYGANTTNYVELSAGTLTNNHSLIFPDSDGSNGQVLSTNGAGVLAWIPIPSAPVTTVFGRTGTVTATSGDYSADLISNTPAGGIVATDVQSALNELDTKKQSTTSLATDVRATQLTGLSTATNAVVVATDTILAAFGKIQAEISAGMVTLTNQGVLISNNTADIANNTVDITTNANDIATLSASMGDYVTKATNSTVTGQITIDNTLGSLLLPRTPGDAEYTAAANVQYVQNYNSTFGQWTLAGSDTYRSTGKVGIGTNAPGSTLDVKGTLRLSGSTSGFVGLAPAANAGSTTYTLPATIGTSGYVLTTDGTSGVLSWTSVAASAMNALTGDVTASGVGSVAATVAYVGGVSAANVASGANLANAATNANTASTIVKRDASGNFTAGTITANLTGNVTGNVTGNTSGTAANVTGTVAVANGGTGKTSVTANELLFGNGTGALSSLPIATVPSVLISTITTGTPTWVTSTTGNVLKGSASGVVFGALAASDLPTSAVIGTGTVNKIPYVTATSPMTEAASPLTVSTSQISAASYNNGSAVAFNMNNGNTQYTTASCGAMTMTNLVDGADYTLLIKGATAGTCTFTSAGFSFRFYPTNGATTASTYSVYSMKVIGTDVLVSWITGF
jgi:hypothetical protein